MHRLFIFIILLLSGSLVYAQVTTNVLLRVIRFQSGDKFGTAFTIEVEGQQYIITARHNLTKSEASVDVKLFLNGAWHPFKARAIYPDNHSVDIVALDVGQKVTVDFPLDTGFRDFALGKQIYIVGYPWGLRTQGGLPDNMAEIPFLKSGILSAIDSRQKDSVIFYLDSDNNPGFSGGPIVYRDSKSGDYRVAAVVSGYWNEAFPVLKEKDLTNPDAKAYEDLYTRGNSGITVGYSVKHIVDAIQKDFVHQNLGQPGK